MRSEKFSDLTGEHLTWSVGRGQRRWVQFGPLCVGRTHIQ